MAFGEKGERRGVEAEAATDEGGEEEAEAEADEEDEDEEEESDERDGAIEGTVSGNGEKNSGGRGSGLAELIWLCDVKSGANGVCGAEMAVAAEWGIGAGEAGGQGEYGAMERGGVGEDVSEWGGWWLAVSEQTDWLGRESEEVGEMTAKSRGDTLHLLLFLFFLLFVLLLLLLMADVSGSRSSTRRSTERAAESSQVVSEEKSAFVSETNESSGWMRRMTFGGRRESKEERETLFASVDLSWLRKEERRWREEWRVEMRE